MKTKSLSKSFLPLVISSAVAGIISSIASPAQAIVWNWSYEGTDVTASGTLTTTDNHTTNGFYTISGITGQRNGYTITGLVPAHSGNGNIWWNNDNGFTGSQPSDNGISYYVGGVQFGEVSLFSASAYRTGLLQGIIESTINTSNEEVSFSATPVPFETGYATIPGCTLVFVLAIGAKKVRQKIALKTRVVKPVETIS
ncbi:hypothetical protein H6F62_19455 [Anabaena sp. FACHB-1391]|uniref:hypothetical protein n=1 Tax=Anabaena sp. FACHB-1391 TaxID=2692771 RepID=UPI0016801AD4|nr:hypothetical protein [Anabaena sp. FACHB-1391]MBD2270868.1 hypothetical protein [Anabaena sp. FACHB-1391]